ncbi:MAG: FadR family transcriptional regulator [Alicyclobacillus macrosporangiidus]|uniref:FadR/GntR family transcriptional regulator n=1 Tax=Alicyclobacillus macrosporangiidus TaxID=392015 RepID=UPI0026EB0556|nr:FadR/GntR family transcriptional regulator [Alicyclobacillus macrosporangiidus]MCL6597848.1 FadR family transcriptional regulator [Alicyclobacillus macrosporangiidus]
MRQRNLSTQLVHEIGRKIVSGQLAPGDILPRVEVLSEMNGVSRTVTREALKALEALRLVESHQKVGTMVRQRTDWHWWSQDVLRWSTETTPNRAFLVQLTEVRLAIEPAAVALAAKNATDEDLQAICESFKRLEASLRGEGDWAKADYEFHDTIILASHNELMLSLVRMLRDALLYSRRNTMPVMQHTTQEASQASLALHKAVLDAVCHRHPFRAYRSMLRLLTAVSGLIHRLDEKEETAWE